MKILKIELQNINSLKSNAPIEIDFQSEQFNDTNLFAITGPTGAGKTTILDAITIALYRRVHRLKGDQLINIVSRGAHFALCCVTFENEEKVFTASWNIRLARKNGTLLTTPQEKVELAKEGEVITTKVSEFEKEIKKIIKLDFNQFLKSMILAQGDFDAFLSAKENERSEVLKQITGNDIFEKVGEDLLKRIKQEKIILDDLTRGINNEDLLGVEERKILEEKLKTLPQEITEIDAHLKEIERGLQYYSNLKNLEHGEKEIAELRERLKQKKASLAAIFLQLDQHDLATPFIDLLRNLDNESKERISKINIKEELQQKEQKLSIKKEDIDHSFKTQNDNVERVIHEIEKWRITYKKASELQIIIQSKKEALSTQQTQLKESTDKELFNLKRKESLSERIKEHTTTVQNLNKVLEENDHLEKFIPLIPSLENDIKSYEKLDVAVLKEQREGVDDKKIQLDKEITALENITLEVNKKEKQLNPLKENLEKIIADLKGQSILDLSNKKTDLIDNRNKLANVILFKTEITALENSVISKKNQQSVAEEAIIELKQKVFLFKDKITDQDERVNDAFKILNLKRKVVNFEKEREELVENEPCSLCGSETHPFVENYQDTKSFSSEEEEYHKRNKVLSNLKEEESKCISKLNLLNNQNDQLILKIKEIENEIVERKLQIKGVNKLFIDCDFEKIEKEEVLLQVQLLDVQKEIETLQSLNSEKDQLTNTIKEKDDIIKKLNLNKHTIQSNISSLETSIKENKERIISINKEKGLLFNKLIDSLGAEKIEAIQEIKIELSAKKKETDLYTHQKETVISLTQEIEKGTLQLNEVINNLNTLKEEITSSNETIQIINNEIDSVIIEKNKIVAPTLDLNTYNQEKETQLSTAQASLESLRSEKVSIDANMIQLKTRTEVLSKEIINVEVKIDENDKQLNQLLENSSFNTIEEVRASILDYQVLEASRLEKENFIKKEVSLKTKEEEHKKSLQKLEVEKDFVKEEEDILRDNSTRIKEKRDLLFTERGKIETQIDKDKLLQERNRELVTKIQMQENVCQKWSDLLRLLGGTKDSFNKFVQHLTLQNLIVLANIHLEKINDRYTLELNDIEFYTNKKTGENSIRNYLDFSIIDHHQAGLIRKTTTASGGEKFMISLSLALGLSDLSSRNVQIESLFIDEGFGTLDEKALDDVLDALESLQNEGKRIGIISHVGSLNNRISTQVQVNKQGKGISSVKVLSIN